MNLRMLIGVAVFSVMSGVAGTAHAQETVLSGTTTDATDAVLPGVTVTALHVESGNTFVAVTDATGRYRIGALRTGAYKITAELAGFSSVSREGVELLLGQRPVINFKLTLSTVQESVTVTGATPLLDMTQSKLGGSIDPLQMRELPINGRNWMDLSMLAPGSRINAIGTNDPLTVRTGQGMQFQLNLDGQQVTYMLSGGGAQPGFSRDAIGEFEFISSRSDATQGRSSGVQVNAITKAGTNRYTGSVSGFFRDDSFNAEDFIVERVLPYSNQQLVGTFGGPIRTDRMHFFANYEYEREAQTVTLTSPFPIFNAVNVSGTRTEYKTGLRVDTQISASTRLMVRGNRFDQLYPVAPSQTGLGGATIHPSSVYSTETVTNAVFATLTQVVGPRVLNEIKVGYSTIANPFKVTEPGLLGVPRIVLRAYTLGNSPTVPQDIGQRNTIIRDDLSFLLRGGGYHDFQVGGEFMYNMTYFNEFPFARDGLLIAAGGPIPSNVEDLFPVWNDWSTWNLAALSPIALFHVQSFGTYSFDDPRNIGAAWVQDNWQVMSRLTLNLGLRYDVSDGSVGENIDSASLEQELLATARFPASFGTSSELLNFQPRLGFAYTLSDDAKTVIRGGFGKHVAEPSDVPTLLSKITTQTRAVTVFNDGRPDFASNPFNGPPLTLEEAKNHPNQSLTHALVSADYQKPYSWQSSIGVQQLLGETMAIEADYVYEGNRREAYTRNETLTYNPTTGANNPVTDVSKRLYPNFAGVSRIYTDGWANYHALQMGFTKRFSQNWQASATYTLGALRSADGGPTGDVLRCVAPGSTVISVCPADFQLAPDLGNDYTLAAGDQRHRAVFNGIWHLPSGFQLSGLYFFGSGQRLKTDYSSGDLRNRGPNSIGGFRGRLRPDGTIMPRNDLVGTPLHRVDLRFSNRFPVGGSVQAEGLFEVFNLFNHANHGRFTTFESSSSFGQPSQNTGIAFQPRTLQLGFRVTF